jgi:hypothetical protein
MDDPVSGLLIILASFTIILSPLIYTWSRGRAVDYRTAVMLACTPLLGIGLAGVFFIIMILSSMLGLFPPVGHKDWRYGVLLLTLGYALLGWFLSVPLGLLLAIYVSLRNRFRSRANHFETKSTH